MGTFKGKISARFKIAAAIAVIMCAAFILSPRFYEPGGEAWKQWAAARILSETGGWPVFSLGPAYVAYLQAFRFFHYPLSVMAEHLITHIFVYWAIFMMLESFVPFKLALLLTCAWIPNIAMLEPGGLVAGIGFIALYLKKDTSSAFNRGYFPPSLLAAALCHSAYIFFVAGNIAGVFIEKRMAFKKIGIFPAAGRIILFAILLLALFSPSRRPDNNQMLSDPTYVPVPVKDPLSVAFFHIGNWKYAMKTAPKEDQAYQDWYLTNDKAFGGAKNILEAIARRPATVVSHIADNAIYVLRIPMRFLTGNFQGVLGKPVAALFTMAALVLLPVGLIGAMRRLKAAGLVSVAYSIVLGSIGITGALVLTWCSPRYVMTLLPVGLLAIANVGYGTGELSRMGHKGSSYIGNAIIILSAMLVLFTTVYPEGSYAQVKAVLGNKGLLSGAKPISMVDSRHELLKSLKRDTSVLAMEDVWIKAFSGVELDRIHCVYGLPPFTDPSGGTEKKLEGLDEIWVNYRWPQPVAGVSTQPYLRYSLHIEPFLKKALARGWTAEEVKGYGTIYRRPR